MDVKKQKRANAEVALVGTLAAADITHFWDKAVAAVTKEVALPGFRKGHVPKERVIQEVGEKSLWREAAELALKDQIDTILKSNEVSSIAPLSLSMKSADKGADVEFEIVATVMPTVEVGDYRAVAERALKSLPKEDTAKEVETAKEAFRAQAKAIAKMSGMAAEVPAGEEKKDDAPLTDDEVKKMGFENAAAFELFIQGEAEKAVEGRAMQKKRSAVAEALIDKFPADIPAVFTREEANALLNAMKRDIVQQGMEWNEYLKRVKKTEEGVAADMLPAANKRITLDLIFSEIVKKEGVKLEGEEDKKKEDELAHAVSSQGAPHDRAHSYARETLLREKVWKLLEVSEKT